MCGELVEAFKFYENLIFFTIYEFFRLELDQ